MSDSEWVQWQDSYAVKRRRVFLDILETRGKHLATTLMRKISLFSHTGDRVIEITHRESDPGTWIVRQFAKIFWFRRRISSHWFNEEHQAIEFADELAKKDTPPHNQRIDAVKETPHNAE